MNKQEIEQLTKLQNNIDEVRRNIDRAGREVKVYCDNERLFKSHYPEIVDNVRILVISELNKTLADLVYQREELVICKGQTDYKAVNILE